MKESHRDYLLRSAINTQQIIEHKQHCSEKIKPKRK